MYEILELVIENHGDLDTIVSERSYACSEYLDEVSGLRFIQESHRGEDAYDRDGEFVTIYRYI